MATAAVPAGKALSGPTMTMNRMQMREMVLLRSEMVVRKWIESVLNITIPPSDFLQHLGDGVILCRLMQTLLPNYRIVFKDNTKEKEEDRRTQQLRKSLSLNAAAAIEKEDDSSDTESDDASTGVQPLMHGQRLKNIQTFLAVCTKIRLEESFAAPDLMGPIYNKDRVLQCLLGIKERGNDVETPPTVSRKTTMNRTVTAPPPSTTTATSTATATATATASASASATATTSATPSSGSEGGNEGVKESSGGALSSAPDGGSVAEGQQGKAAEGPAQTQGQEGGQQVEEAAVMVSAGSSDKAATTTTAAAASSPGGSAGGATAGGVAVAAAAGATAGAVVLVAAGTTTTTAAGDVESSRDSKEAEEEAKAATKIQAGFRGYQVRQEIKAQDEAATKIQASFRGHKTRKELGGEPANSNEGGDAAGAPLDDTAGAPPATTGPADQSTPSETMAVVSGTGASESTTPGGPDTTTAAASDVGGDACDSAAATTSTPADPAAGAAGADGDAEAKAATKIQAGFRGYQVRQEIKAQDEAATKIQASFRGHKTRKELESTSVDGQAAAGPTATATAEGASGGLDPTATSSGSTGAAESGVASADASTAPSAAAAAAADANTDANAASATTTATTAGAVSTGDAPPTESGGADDAVSGSSSSPPPAVAVAAVAGAAVGGAVLVGAAASAGSEAGPTAGDDEASSGGKAKGKKAKGGDDDEDGDGEGGGGGADLDATLEKLSQSMTLVKSGSLLKRGTKAQTKKVVWKMRQFVLTDAALVYGDLKSGQSPKGALKVSDMAVCRITQAERDNCIEIVTRTKSFFLGAASREEANEWMAAVNSLLPTPDFPADPVECWLTWRRAFEDDYFPTFFKFKRGNRGTNYRFAELCGAGVSSLSDIILPPFSITRNGADCTINVRDDVHGRIGFIILVKMQEGEGWQIVSEDWKAADAATSGKKADEDDDDEDDGEGEGEGDGETVDASDSTTNLAPGEKGKDEAGSSSAQAAGAATTTVSPAASSAGPAAGGAAAAGAVVAGGAVAAAGAAGAAAMSSGAASSTGAAGSDGSSAAGGSGSGMSAADVARSASISRAAALDSATQPRGYQVYATETKIKEGVLQKRGGERKVWHARQITLTSTKLVYAATGKNGKVKGEILVSDMECAAINTTEKKKKYCFELVSRERTYYFEAASQNELNEWLAAFDRLLEVPNFEAADWSCWKLWRAAFENNYLPTIARFRAPGMQSKFTFAELIQCGVPRLGDLALPPAKIDKSSTEVHIITVESKQGGHIGKITVTARGGGKAGWLVAGEEWSNDPSKADGSGASGSGTASSSATANATATGTGTSSDKGKDPASASAGAGGGEDGAEEGSDEDGGDFIRTGAISATPAAGEVEVKSGVLSKRGGSRKNWNTRQIVLSNVKLTYAAVGKGKPIKGSIPVADMVYAIPNTSEKKKFCLELITRSRRYYMFAKKQEEIDGWFQAFAEVLKVPAFSTDPYECWRLWRTAFETNYAPTQYVFKRDKDGFVYADFPVDSDVPRVANVTLLATMTSGNAAHLSLEAPGGFNGTVALEQLPGTPGWLVLGEDWTKVEPTTEAGPSAGTATTGPAAGSEGEASATSATASPAAQPEESPAT